MSKPLTFNQLVWRIRKVMRDAGLEVKSSDMFTNQGDAIRLYTKSGDNHLTVDIQESIFELPTDDDW